MIDLTSREEVVGLQSNLRATLGGEQGKEVLKFLEDICGWYDFADTDPSTVLVKTGKRQILATIKTLLRLTPDQIVALAKEA